MLDFLDEQPESEPVSYGEEFDILMVDSMKYSPYTRSKNRMRGSELGGECIRLNSLRLDTLDMDGMSGWGVIAAESGKAIENLLVRNMVVNHPEKVAAYDMWCPKIPELEFSGKLDFIYRPNDNDLVVVDFKTTQRLNEKEQVVPLNKAVNIVEEFSDSIKDMTKALKKGKKYSAQSTLKTLDQYMWQVAAYCTFTFIDTGMLYIISRSPEQWNEPFTRKIEEFEITSDIRNLVVARALVAQHAYNEGRLVPKPKDFKKTVQCKYCDFNSFCWGEDQGDWRYYSEEEFNTLFTNALAHAPLILNEHEVKLKNATRRGIEDTKKRIELIQNPSEEKIKEYLKKSEMNMLDILINVKPFWDAEHRESFEALLNINIDS